MSVDEALAQQTADRAALLEIHADLYEEIHQFLDGLATRWYEKHKAAANSISMQAAQTAMDLRTEYKNLVRTNREDVAIYRTWLGNRDVAP